MKTLLYWTSKLWKKCTFFSYSFPLVSIPALFFHISLTIIHASRSPLWILVGLIYCGRVWLKWPWGRNRSWLIARLCWKKEQGGLPDEKNRGQFWRFREVALICFIKLCFDITGRKKRCLSAIWIQSIRDSRVVYSKSFRPRSKRAW